MSLKIEQLFGLVYKLGILQASTSYTNCQSSKVTFALRPTVHMQKESQFD